MSEEIYLVYFPGVYLTGEILCRAHSEDEAKEIAAKAIPNIGLPKNKVERALKGLRAEVVDIFPEIPYVITNGDY